MSTITAPAATAAPKPLYTSLFVQVLAALMLGIVLGMAAPDFAIGLKIFSDAFLKLISMIVAPIVFCVVVHGIAGAGDLKKVGRVGVKALIYFEVMTTVALVVGLLLAYLFGPGHGMNIDPSTLDAKALNTYADNAHKLQGGGIGSLPAQHHPDHLVRRAVAQRRAAGAVLRDPVRRRPGAGRRREGREDHLDHRRGLDRAVPRHGADRAALRRSACSARSPTPSANTASARSSSWSRWSRCSTSRSPSSCSACSAA